MVDIQLYGADFPRGKNIEVISFQGGNLQSVFILNNIQNKIWISLLPCSLEF